MANNLFEVSTEIANRLTRIFPRDDKGRRLLYGGAERFQTAPPLAGSHPVLKILPRRQRGWACCQADRTLRPSGSREIPGNRETWCCCGYKKIVITKLDTIMRFWPKHPFIYEVNTTGKQYCHWKNHRHGASLPHGRYKRHRVTWAGQDR